MKINGIAASDGIAIGKVFKLETVVLTIPTHNTDNAEAEMLLFEKACAKAVKELEVIKEKTRVDIDEEHALIFDAHIQIVSDPEILGQVTHKVKTEQSNVIKAYDEVTNMFIQIFLDMDDDYFKERASDIKDVKTRVVTHLLGKKTVDPSTVNEDVIVVADDLTPSDTAQLNKEYTLGFLTNMGGRTSHSAIMARSLEIPAIVGMKDIFDQLNDQEIVIMNGIDGYIIKDPTDIEINEHIALQKEFLSKKEQVKKFKDVPSVTTDGHHVELAANIGSPDDLEAVLNNGAEGVGLYRTEFLYMNSDKLPDEEIQYNAYKKVLETMNNKKVIIRTLDIGGDKNLPYFKLDHEMNPFLGHRALRLCLEYTDIFKTQLRALLRASIYGNLHIMFPMVATIDELRDAKKILNECKLELNKENIEYSKTYKVGIMVEIPSVAVLADIYAKEVDFFSIGTNDLIQYSFAADRMNQKVSYLYQPYNPSLLRLIKMVIDASHKENIWTGMCGEVAGDYFAIPLLLGLGLDEFSMSATSVLQSRQLVNSLSQKDMKNLAEKALKLATNKDVLNLVKTTLDNIQTK